MASGDNAKAAGVPGQGIEVEGDLDKTDGLAPAVGMPHGIACVVVAVGTDVVVIRAEQVDEKPVDAGIVQQGAEAFVLVDERYDAGPPFSVVRLPVVTASAVRPDLLKGVDDVVNNVGHQTGQAQISERVEKRELLPREQFRHIGTSFGCTWILENRQV